MWELQETVPVKICVIRSKIDAYGENYKEKINKIS